MSTIISISGIMFWQTNVTGKRQWTAPWTRTLECWPSTLGPVQDLNRAPRISHSQRFSPSRHQFPSILSSDSKLWTGSKDLGCKWNWELLKPCNDNGVNSRGWCCPWVPFKLAVLEMRNIMQTCCRLSYWYKCKNLALWQRCKIFRLTHRNRLLKHKGHWLDPPETA